MTPMIRIRSAGPHTSVQDKGRAGYQGLGVPEGGALDQEALLLGNALVGNSADAAGLEICLGGVGIELLSPCRVALTGTTGGVMTVQDETGQVLDVPSNRSVDLSAGRVIRLGILPDTNTATLAFAGGIDVAPLFGSMATSPSAGIGGMEGRLLRDGDILPLKPSETAGAPEWISEYRLSPRASIRCVPGPQDDRFTDAAMKTFFGEMFEVSPVLNRMGMRLDGPQLMHLDTADILSDGIVTGSVQVPGEGKPIILLADHQTTGGYTKIATVISADLPSLARLKPGQKIRFEAVSVAEAEALARAGAQQLERAITSFRPAPPLMDQGALYQLGDTT
ncbi:biotin-dependent carboxyltransferase family protein [Alphaproteobacteria bacterium LSUCC0684]